MVLLPINLPPFIGDQLRNAFETVWVNLQTLDGGGVGGGQPLDADLTAIAALTGTGLFYRSAADTWSPVTIGANLTFTAGTLAASASGSGYHADVASFQARVVADGGTVDAMVLAALDRFVRRGIRDGWYASIVEMHPFVGGSFDAALHKLKYLTAPKLPSATFVAGDYSQESGFGPGTGSGKKVSLGFTLADAGISNAAGYIFIAPTMSNFAGGNDGGFVGNAGTTNPGHVDVMVRNGHTVWASDSGVFAANAINNLRVTGLSFSPGLARSILNNVTEGHFVSPNSFLTNAELQLFAARRFNVQYFAGGKLGATVFGNAVLTEVQAQSLGDALEILQADIGRSAYAPKPTLTIIGDSNTAPILSWAERAAKALGLKSDNYSNDSMYLTADANSLRSVSSQASQFAARPSNVVLVCIGTNDVIGVVTDVTYKTHLHTLVSTLVAAGKKVILCSIPYNGIATYASVRAYVVAAKEVANDNNCTFVNFEDAIRDKPVPVPTYTSVDNIHLDTPGHILLGERVTRASRGQLTRELSLNFGSIAAGASATLPVEVLTAQVGKLTSVTPPPGLEPGLTVTATVTALDTVTVRVSNGTAAAIDPAAGVFTVHVDAYP